MALARRARDVRAPARARRTPHPDVSAPPVRRSSSSRSALRCPSRSSASCRRRGRRGARAHGARRGARRRARGRGPARAPALRRGRRGADAGDDEDAAAPRARGRAAASSPPRRRRPPAHRGLAHGRRRDRTRAVRPRERPRGRAGRSALALRLAEAAGGGFGAVVAEGVALNALARFDRAEAVLAPHEPAAATMDEAVLVDVRRHALPGVAARRPRRPPGTACSTARRLARRPGWDAVIATQRGWVELYRSRPTAALRRSAAAGRRALSALQQFHVHAVAMNAQARLGLTDQCLETAARTRALVARSTRRLGGAVRDAHVRAAPVHRGCARPRRASRPAARRPDRGRGAQDPALRVTATLGLGILLLRRGQSPKPRPARGGGGLARGRRSGRQRDLRARCARVRPRPRRRLAARRERCAKRGGRVRAPPPRRAPQP